MKLDRTRIDVIDKWEGEEGDEINELAFRNLPKLGHMKG